MPVVDSTPSELALGHMPMAQGAAGDAASPAAIRRLSHALADRKGPNLKAQKKTLEQLKAAVASIRVGDYDAGARRALAILQVDEQNGLAWHVLAICREKSGHLSEALNAYDAALRILPEDANIAHDLARLAQRLGHLDIAEKLLRKFLAVEPGHIEGTNNLACVLRDQKRYQEAIDALRDLIQIEQTNPTLWNTLGTVLSDQGQMRESLTFFNESLRLDPTFAKARYNRANALQPLGEPARALDDLNEALKGAETPYEHAMMRMAKAMTLMGMGRLKEGFEEYEVRLDPEMPEAMHVVVDAPRWDPETEEIRGKRLLVVGEQGIADEMVFGACLPDVIDAVGPDGKVFIAVEPRLVDLYQRSFPTAVVGGHRAVRLEGRLTRYCPFMEEIGETEGKADCWIPMASLCTVYRQDISDFPDRDGYLVPDPAKVARWKSELEGLGPGLKVGLHWKSLVLTGVRARYFSSFERWKPVLTAPGCVMVNLQCGDVTEDLAAAEAAGVKIWTPPMNLKDDLDDLAALSNALDLVIGPGIAGTNMAAASGARTWLIHAPDDWHLLNTDHYPFYPRVRTFATGGFDGWPRAIAEVRAALEAEIK
ncbi:tetratricopeptide repeat protein [Brevundimonas sp. NIBR11]|uniref:tetratricopeptide repeat protein n=1 Tax=Brevundimonas sp. NIBR11 TaxID=3015999 RepID=UPI0022F0E30F|nr:tetratricopeptide repeat protein [Brevundimonas sp. NIBR11]WGM30623.1 Beta-barrel assembly-enhancing protease [Brevundimonas sp. NIBR11]